MKLISEPQLVTHLLLLLGISFTLISQHQGSCLSVEWPTPSFWRELKSSQSYSSFQDCCTYTLMVIMKEGGPQMPKWMTSLLHIFTNSSLCLCIRKALCFRFGVCYSISMVNSSSYLFVGTEVQRSLAIAVTCGSMGPSLGSWARVDPLWGLGFPILEDEDLQKLEAKIPLRIIENDTWNIPASTPSFLDPHILPVGELAPFRGLVLFMDCVQRQHSTSGKCRLWTAL